MRLWMMAGVLALAGCAGDETVGAYGAADQDWHLQSIDGVAFSAKAVLRFPQEGQLSGEAPAISSQPGKTRPIRGSRRARS